MNNLYLFLSGPMVWVAFGVFLLGSLYRLADLLRLVHTKEPFIYSYMSWKYSLRSIFRWLLPFGTPNWRSNPALTVVTFAFHLSLLIAPLFLMAHLVLWRRAFGLGQIPALPAIVADLMTVIVLIGCVFFAARRIFLRHVQFVTSPGDYILLAIVAAPFLTGFLAFHQWGSYSLMMVLHLLSGEIMLMAIPFTRLSHMLFAPLTRAYMGSEFGGVRHVKDW